MVVGRNDECPAGDDNETCDGHPAQQSGPAPPCDGWCWHRVTFLRLRMRREDRVGDMVRVGFTW
jgi:hypothetical protein